MCKHNLLIYIYKNTPPGTKIKVSLSPTTVWQLNYELMCTEIKIDVHLFWTTELSTILSVPYLTKKTRNLMKNDNFGETKTKFWNSSNVFYTTGNR